MTTRCEFLHWGETEIFLPHTGGLRVVIKIEKLGQEVCQYGDEMVVRGPPFLPCDPDNDTLADNLQFCNLIVLEEHTDRGWGIRSGKYRSSSKAFQGLNYHLTAWEAWNYLMAEVGKFIDRLKTRAKIAEQADLPPKKQDEEETNGWLPE